MATLAEVIISGTRADQPDADTVGEGTLYRVSDEGGALERSNGAVWEATAITLPITTADVIGLDATLATIPAGDFDGTILNPHAAQSIPDATPTSMAYGTLRWGNGENLGPNSWWAGPGYVGQSGVYSGECTIVAAKPATTLSLSLEVYAVRNGVDELIASQHIDATPAGTTALSASWRTFIQSSYDSVSIIVTQVSGGALDVTLRSNSIKYEGA